MPRLIRTDAALRDALPRLASARELAVDTEFHSERTYEPALMLVQLQADADEPLLVDALAGLDLTLLAEPLSTGNVVVHGGAADMRILHRAIGAPLRVVFDTQLAAAFVGDGFPVRLQDLVRRHLGLRLGKGETLSDWSRRPLTDEQVAYAAEDVRVLGPLRRAIEARLQASGHAALFDACLVEARTAAEEPERDEDAWKTIPGAATADDEERAALAALARWRQGEARRRGVPRHTLASDGILLDIARRRPASVEMLRANRRMPTSVWRVHGEEILGVLRAVPAGAPPPLIQHPRGWGDLVRAFARIRELETGISADLVIGDAVLAALGRGEPLPPWRVAALGPNLRPFLDGDHPLRMPANWHLR